KFQTQGSVELDIPTETVVSLVVCGNTAIVCPDSMTPKLVDLKEMKVVGSLDTIGDNTIKRTANAADGRVAILDTQGKLWVIDNPSDQPESLKPVAPNLVGQGSVSSMAFDQEGRLWVAHHIKQVDVWDKEF
ncbi:MAG: hypothetical protein ACKOAH_11175, partial [Pirellula sp.]